MCHGKVLLWQPDLTSHDNGPDKHVENQRIYRYWSRCVEGKERCENREENHKSEGEGKNFKNIFTKCTGQVMRCCRQVS